MPAPKVTVENIEKAIKRGDGQGHGIAYTPWIQIRRWNSSPVSTQVPGCLPPFYQRQAYLAVNEWHVALVMAWLQIEVRTQFPVWPWPHPHPLYGLDSQIDSYLSWSNGMQSVCKEAGIKHGNYPGTKIPFVWSLDLVLTIGNIAESSKCVVVSIKWVDDERFKDELNPIDRQIEKLECERRYCAELEIPYFVTGSDMFPKHLKTNLAFLVSASKTPDENSERFRLIQEFKDKYLDYASLYPIEEWSIWMQEGLRSNLVDAHYVTQYLLWHQIVDADLTISINLREPPKPGGIKYRSNLLGGMVK